MSIAAYKRMEARLTEVMGRATEELSKLESRRVEVKNQLGSLTYIIGGSPQEEVPTKKKRVLSLSARKRIADAQRARWAKTKRLQKSNGHATARSSNASNPAWTDKDDSVIVQGLKAKGEPVDAPEFARSLVKRLHHRSEGAIRQRINRLAKDGVLKQAMNGNGVHGGVPHMMVEAA